MKTGIFGGSFNPIHKGHVNFALAAKSQLCLDKMIIIPSYISPQKSENDYRGTKAQDRYNMCRLASGDLAGFEVSDFEIKRPEKSYTVNTLKHFKNLYPQDEFFLLLGSDSFYYFDKWYRAEEIMSLASLCVMSRDFNEEEKIRKKVKSFGENSRIYLVNGEPFPISSTILRSMIKNHKEVSCYLNRNVVKYIVDRNLYI